MKKLFSIWGVIATITGLWAYIHFMPVPQGMVLSELWAATQIYPEDKTTFINIPFFFRGSSVKDTNLATPPGSPSEGDRYIVGSVGTDTWLNKENQIAEWHIRSGGTAQWYFLDPWRGLSSWCEGDSILYVFNGASWVGSGTIIGPVSHSALSDLSYASSGHTGFQSALTFVHPLVNTTGSVSMQQASGTDSGFLSKDDWTTFNNKEPAITVLERSRGGTGTAYGAPFIWNSVLDSVIPDTSTGDTDLSANFVFGSDRMDYDTTAKAGRTFFNKSLSAFRAGYADTTTWNASNLGLYSAAFGYRTKASSDGAFAEGSATTASGACSHAEGANTTASGAATHAEGSNSTASLYGQSARAAGNFSAGGDAQYSRLIFRVASNTATDSELFLGTSTRAVIPANKTWAFEGLISARTDTDTSAAYKIEGCIERNGANNTVLVGTPVITVLAEEDASWNITVTADDTNEALRIGVFGTAGVFVRWVCALHLTEVAY